MTEVKVGGEIPDKVRQEIDERDQFFCRMCGVHTESVLGGREIHHIDFGGDAIGIGGSRVHDPKAMISLCRKCHVRSHQNKSKWQNVLLYVARQPGFTAAQVLRWEKRAQTNRRVIGQVDAGEATSCQAEGSQGK